MDWLPCDLKSEGNTQLAVNMLVANLHVAYDGDVYFHTVKTMAAATVISRIVVFIVVLKRECENEQSKRFKQHT